LLDGEFGQETEAVVKTFQRAHGLKADGIVGRNTLARLDAIFGGLETAEGPSIRAAMHAPQGWAIS
jgi:peptidoglycan hydrolase-like protein with peptidoglycan-binding domain